MFRKAWRTLPWIPVLWTVDDAVVSARKIDRARCGVALEGEEEEEEDLKSGLESETKRVGKRERDHQRDFDVYAVLDKVSYRYEDVARGDAVCVPRPGSRGFNSFSSSSSLEMQRVVALENDLVAWKTKTRKNAKRGGEEKEESRDATVPKGHCFIASENENIEHVGIVPIALIEAKVRYAVVFDGGAARVRSTNASAKKEEEEEESRGGKVVVRRRYF
jgi:hypothetical protein